MKFRYLSAAASIIFLMLPAHAMHILYAKKLYTHLPYVRKNYYHAESQINTIQNVLSQTDMLFKEVPGYTKVVHRLCNSLNGPLPHTSKGFLYELQVALDFYYHGHVICAFEKKYKNKNNTCQREFDIITNLCAIECKNINWDFIQKSPEDMLNLQQQIHEQYTLVKSGVVGVPHYIFCSKNVIPEEQCTWLHMHQILYFIYNPSLS